MHQGRHEAGDYRRIELITGGTRRRRWTVEEKSAIVAESLRPGINLSGLARRCGVNRGLLQTWRRMAKRDAAGAGLFVPLRIEAVPATPNAEKPTGNPGSAAPAVPAPATEIGAIEVECAGLRVRFTGPIDPAALGLVLEHVGRRT